MIVLNVKDYDRRKKLYYIAIAILVFLLLLFAIWWWLYGRQPNQPPAPVNQNNPAHTLPRPTQNIPGQGALILDAGQQNAVRLARFFTERFGTFTSQSQFESIRELSSVSTSSFSEWMIGSYVAELRRQYPSDSYIGQTTTVLSTELAASTDNAATVNVRTQQRLSKGAEAPVTTSPTLVVKLVKSGEGWLVDSATWQR